MTTRRASQLFAAALGCLLVAGALVATEPAAAQPKGAYETPPALAGSALAPAALLAGPLHTVAEPVALDGFFGRFVIESRFGKFSVAGVNMLGVRVNELQRDRGAAGSPEKPGVPGLAGAGRIRRRSSWCKAR